MATSEKHTVLQAVTMNKVNTMFRGAIKANTVLFREKTGQAYFIKVEDRGTVLYRIDKMTSSLNILEHTAVRYITDVTHTYYGK